MNSNLDLNKKENRKRKEKEIEKRKELLGQNQPTNSLRHPPAELRRQVGTRYQSPRVRSRHYWLGPTCHPGHRDGNKPRGSHGEPPLFHASWNTPPTLRDQMLKADLPSFRNPLTHTRMRLSRISRQEQPWWKVTTSVVLRDHSAPNIGPRGFTVLWCRPSLRASQDRRAGGRNFSSV